MRDQASAEAPSSPVGATTSGSVGRATRAINVEEDIRQFSEFRADAAGLLAQVRCTMHVLVLTQRGHTSAVVLDPAVYQRLVDELELLRDIHAASRELERGEEVSQRAVKAQALARLWE